MRRPEPGALPLRSSTAPTIAQAPTKPAPRPSIPASATTKPQPQPQPKPPARATTPQPPQPKRKPGRRPTLDLARALAMRADGATVPAIADALGTTRSTICRALAAEGVALGRWTQRAAAAHTAAGAD